MKKDKTTIEKIAFITRSIGEVHIVHYNNTVCPPLVFEEIPAHYTIYCRKNWGGYTYEVSDVDIDVAVDQLCKEIWGNDYEL